MDLYDIYVGHNNVMGRYDIYVEKNSVLCFIFGQQMKEEIEKNGATFLNYDPKTGILKFKVYSHFPLKR